MKQYFTKLLTGHSWVAWGTLKQHKKEKASVHYVKKGLRPWSTFSLNALSCYKSKEKSCRRKVEQSCQEAAVQRSSYCSLTRRWASWFTNCTGWEYKLRLRELQWINRIPISSSLHEHHSLLWCHVRQRKCKSLTINWSKAVKRHCIIWMEPTEEEFHLRTHQTSFVS